MGGVSLTAAKGKQWAELRVADETFLPAHIMVEYANQLKNIVPDGNVDLQIEGTRFECGKDLLDMVSELKTELKSGEVSQ